MKILLIEDSERLQRSIKEGFINEGFAVDVSSDGRTGYAMAEAYDYDVVILDLMLPQMGGLTVLRRMRESANESQVLILSAKDQVDDRICGLEMGADDYLIKPFVFNELVARVRALLRRKYGQKDPIIEMGSLEINTSNHQVKKAGEILDLTPKEYGIFEYLLMRRGNIISRDQLTEHLYEGYGDIASNVIDVVICTLRKKIHVPGEPALIRTKRGAGYLIM